MRNRKRKRTREGPRKEDYKNNRRAMDLFIHSFIQPSIHSFQAWKSSKGRTNRRGRS